MKIRHLVTMAGAKGALPRYFWMPSPGLRKEGWKARRVPENFATYVDGVALRMAAIAAVETINGEVDFKRFGGTVAQAVKAPAMATVHELVEAYLRSKQFEQLGVKTQRTYKQTLNILEAWAGAAPLRTITRERVEVWYEAHQDQKARANNFMRTGKLLFNFGKVTLRPALVRGDNPFEGVKIEELEQSGRVWPEAAVIAFVAAADKLGYHAVGTAVMLNEWTAQRPGDVLNFPRNVLRPKGLIVTPAKTWKRTKKAVILPIASVPHLVERVEAELARQAAAGVVATKLLVNPNDGMAYTERTFGRHFDEVRTALAAETPAFETDYLMPKTSPSDPGAFTLKTADLWFTHLRHTGITRLAERGATALQISNISGHSVRTIERMLETYMIRTGEAAREAFALRSNGAKVITLEEERIA